MGFAVHAQDQLDTSIYIPVADVDIPLSYAYYPFLFLVIAGAANGANLTDGLDGLAAGTGIIALLTFLAITVIGYIRSGDVGQRSDFQLDLAILAAALIGAAIGFLWYNAFPAELFMGDTGSMAFGGALAGFAIVTGTEALLVLIAGIYVVEALSVIIQTVSFKYWGRRVFLIAPIHHHFEMKAWSETKIMVRFWIIAAIFAAAGFVLYYRYYLQFRLSMKRVLVLGLARSGRAAKALLEANGVEVVAADRDARERHRPRAARRRRGARQEPRGARRGRARRRGARARHPGLERDRARLALICENPIVGVTGTNGKTTTTELLGAILGAPNGRKRREGAERARRRGGGGRVHRVRALELPARGRRELPAQDRRPPEPRARPPRPARQLRARTATRSCGSSRTRRRTTSRSCRAASARCRARGGASSSPRTTSCRPSR